MTDHIVTKLISRNMHNVSGKMRLLQMKRGRKLGGHNVTGTAYSGWVDGVYCEITHEVTRHMGDFIRLHVARNDFPTMAALCRHYRAIKWKLA